MEYIILEKPIIQNIKYKKNNNKQNNFVKIRL